MAEMGGIRSLVLARMRVVLGREREEAVAMLARGGGRPVFRREACLGGPADARTGDEVVTGLYRNAGTGSAALLGVVASREELLRDRGSSPPGRSIVIDAVATDEGACWTPSVRTLLAASAACLVATLHHDPAVRTHVALRAPPGDAEADATADALGAHGPEPIRAVPPPPEERSDDLRRLDAGSAVRAARIVTAAIAGGGGASRVAGLRGRSWACEMTVSFPTVFDHLLPELRQVAHGLTNVGWGGPGIAMNDVSLRELADAAGC